MSMTVSHAQSVGVQTTSDNDFEFTFYTDIVANERLRVVVPLEDAVDLLRDLANHVANAMSSAVRDIKVGDCPTCRNVRLIDVEHHGRTSRDRCPDCGAAWTEAHKETWARPRIGGGIS